MRQSESTTSDITYVQGPNGQNVVLVPSKQPKYSELEADNSACICIAVLFILVGVVAIIIGLVLLVFYLTASDFKSKVVQKVLIATLSLLGLGVLLFVATIPICYYMDKYHSSQVDRYMHRDAPEERRPVLRQEEVLLEEMNPEVFARSYEIYNPTESEVPTGGQRGNYSPGFASRIGMNSHPSQMTYPPNLSHTNLDVDPRDVLLLRQYEDRHSPSQNPLHYPEGTSPGRNYNRTTLRY